MNLPSSRLCNAAGVAGSIVAMLFAYYYLQRTLGLDPCPLCLIDRGLVMLAGFFFLLAFIHNPGRTGQRVYGGLALIPALLGVAVCWRHLWLESLPKHLVPECSPGLEYMLETFPIGETIRTIFNSAGECAEVKWRFLGLSIAGQTLLVFLGFTALSLLQILRKRD